MKHVKTILAAAVAGGLMAAGPALAQQPPQDKGPSGEAYVREITGPEVQVKKGQTPRVIAFFPAMVGTGGGMMGGSGKAMGFEVSIVERPSQQAQQGQNGGGMGGSGQDREIVFADASAAGGIVRYDFQNGGPYANQAHKLVLTARKISVATGGQDQGPTEQSLQIQQVGGSGDLYVFRVMPPPPTEAEKKQMQQEQEAKQKAAEERRKAATQAAAEREKAATQQAANGGANGGQAQPQPPAAAPEPPDEPEQEMTPAIITIYLAPPA